MTKITMTTHGVVELSEREFNDHLSKHDLVLVDFFADWCMPCLMMAPVMEEMSEKFAGKISFAKVNVDDNTALANKFRVLSIPNFILFEKGKIKEQFVGGMDPSDFEERLDTFVA